MGTTWSPQHPNLTCLRGRDTAGAVASDGASQWPVNTWRLWRTWHSESQNARFATTAGPKSEMTNRQLGSVSVAALLWKHLANRNETRLQCLD